MNQQTKHLKNARYTFKQFKQLYPNQAAQIEDENFADVGLFTLAEWLTWVGDDFMGVYLFRRTVNSENPPIRD